MPLRPNFIERRLIDRGTIPGVLLDASMDSFTVQAVTAAMELGVFDELRGESLDAETLADRTGADPEGIEMRRLERGWTPPRRCESHRKTARSAGRSASTPRGKHSMNGRR